MSDFTTKIRYGLLAVTVFLFLHHGGATLLATPPICDSVCSSSTACTETCYVDMMEYENGNDITCLQYGVYDMSTCCGDEVCDPDELGSCSSDCPTPCSGAGCPECDPNAQTGCSTGQVCNAQGVCKDIPNCTGSGCDTPKGPGPCYDDYCYIGANTCCPGNHCWQPHLFSYPVCVPNTSHK